MPQLRQMVLDNAKRIDRNELMINIMRKKTAEQTRKISERDESLEISRKEHDRHMKNIDERLDRIAQLTEASKNKQEEHENELKETWRLVRENSAQMNESREVFDKRMKESDEAFDRQMKESREEFDKRMKESDEAFEKRMKQSDEKFEKRMKESDEAFNKRMKESREEFDKRMKESDEAFNKRMKESEEAFEKRMKESEEKFNRQLNEEYAKTNESIRRISIEFIGVTGHMVEGLIGSSAEKIFQEAGFDLHDRGKNLVRVLAPGNRQMEVDAMLGNESVVVPVEVKEHFTKRKVKRWLHKMETFREFFPEYAGKEVLAAVAAINYEAGAAELAHEEGLLVIRVSSEDIFSLDPVDKKKLRRF